MVGDTMASAEHEPITGVWGSPPAGSRGRAPGQGVRGRSPPEAESILVIGCPTEPANFAPFQKYPFELPLQVVQKFYVEIQGCQVTPVAPSCGRPCLTGFLFCLFSVAHSQCLCSYDLIIIYYSSICDTGMGMRTRIVWMGANPVGDGDRNNGTVENWDKSPSSSLIHLSA